MLAFEQLKSEVYSILMAAPAQIDYTEEFIIKLTDNEKEALLAIIDELQEGSGRISVVKMMQKTGHSRPVYTSLINKMKEYRIAMIENNGAKGTSIELFNKDLKEMIQK